MAIVVVSNKVTRYYYVDGKRVGDVSNDGASPKGYMQGMAARIAKRGSYANWKPMERADFDQNYQPITPPIPGPAPTPSAKVVPCKA